MKPEKNNVKEKERKRGRTLFIIKKITKIKLQIHYTRLSRQGFVITKTGGYCGYINGMGSITIPRLWRMIHTLLLVYCK